MNDETPDVPRRFRRKESKRWRFNRWDALSVLGLLLLLGMSLLFLYGLQMLSEYLQVGQHWFGKDSVVDGAVQTGIAGALLAAYRLIGPFGFSEPPRREVYDREYDRYSPPGGGSW